MRTHRTKNEKKENAFDIKVSCFCKNDKNVLWKYEKYLHSLFIPSWVPTVGYTLCSTEMNSNILLLSSHCLVRVWIFAGFLTWRKSNFGFFWAPPHGLWLLSQPFPMQGPAVLHSLRVPTSSPFPTVTLVHGRSSSPWMGTPLSLSHQSSLHLYPSFSLPSQLKGKKTLCWVFLKWNMNMMQLYNNQTTWTLYFILLSSQGLCVLISHLCSGCWFSFLLGQASSLL